MELKTFLLCALHRYMENDCSYMEIKAVVFVVKLAGTNQTEHRFTHQKHRVSLLFLHCYLSPQYFHATLCCKRGQIIPPFYIIAVISRGNWFLVVEGFTMTKPHAHIFLYLSD